LSRLRYLASSHAGEPLARQPADYHIHVFQAMRPEKSFQIGNGGDVCLDAMALKVVGVGLTGQRVVVHTQANVAAGHLKAQAHAACAAEEVEHNRIWQSMCNRMITHVRAMKRFFEYDF